MNQYDPRINNEHCIRDPFTVDTAKQYIGKKGYFTDDIFNFSNLDSCCDGMLVSIEVDNSHPYYCGISDEGVIIKGNFSFFLSAEFVKEKPEEKRYRPYTLMEFIDKFTVGRPIKYRSKGEAGHEHYLMLLGFWLASDKDQTIPYISIGNFKYTLQELFEEYEWQEHYTEDFKPFGVVEDKE